MSTALDHLGIWLGGFGWVIGFALVTLPDTLRFAGPLLNGAALTLVALAAIEALARRAPGYVSGAIALAIAAVGAYWALICEPAIHAQPDVLARLEALGASAHFPPLVSALAALLGLVLIGCAWLRPGKSIGDLWQFILDLFPH